MTEEFKLILATSNKDKAREIAEILSDTPFVVSTMKEEGFNPDIVEDGKTFEENALIKARAVHALAKNAYVMADDSGLCIDALDGAPGIYSARFCGEDSTYPEKFAKIFETLFSGIFPTQGSNPSLLVGRWILYYCTTWEAPES